MEHIIKKLKKIFDEIPKSFKKQVLTIESVLILFMLCIYSIIFSGNVQTIVTENKLATEKSWIKLARTHPSHWKKISKYIVLLLKYIISHQTILLLTQYAKQRYVEQKNVKLLFPDSYDDFDIDNDDFESYDFESHEFDNDDFHNDDFNFHKNIKN